LSTLTQQKKKKKYRKKKPKEEWLSISPLKARKLEACPTNKGSLRKEPKKYMSIKEDDTLKDQAKE